MERKKGRGMEGARAHFHVVWLHDDATLLSPILLKGKN